jgi:hypothetical protein
MNSSTGLATGMAVGMALSNSQNRDIRSTYEKTCIDTKSRKVSEGLFVADYHTEIIDTCKNNEIIASTTKRDITCIGVISGFIFFILAIIVIIWGLFKILDY